MVMSNNQRLWSLTRDTASVYTHDQRRRPATSSTSMGVRAPMGLLSSISSKDVSESLSIHF